MIAIVEMILWVAVAFFVSLGWAQFIDMVSR
jgi:hypothetical protein